MTKVGWPDKDCEGCEHFLVEDFYKDFKVSYCELVPKPCVKRR